MRLEQVLTEDSNSKGWVRDPESRSVPLEIVKDEQGRIYVRAQVRHFCWWIFCRRDRLDKGKELYKTESIPFMDRRWHQSHVTNSTPHDITIHAFAWRMSQWDAAVESVKAGAGPEGTGVRAEVAGRLQKQVHAPALLPQMVPIPSGHSQWLEISRVGGGLVINAQSGRGFRH